MLSHSLAHRTGVALTARHKPEDEDDDDGPGDVNATTGLYTNRGTYVLMCVQTVMHACVNVTNLQPSVQYLIDQSEKVTTP